MSFGRNIAFLFRQGIPFTHARFSCNTPTAAVLLFTSKVCTQTHPAGRHTVSAGDSWLTLIAVAQRSELRRLSRLRQYYIQFQVLDYKQLWAHHHDVKQYTY